MIITANFPVTSKLDINIGKDLERIFFPNICKTTLKIYVIINALNTFTIFLTVISTYIFSRIVLIDSLP